jgi:hypothetical protein
MSYKYYDYLKKYNAPFLNKYENWTHTHWGRRSNYQQLLDYRAYSLMTGRPIFLYGWKFKSWYFMLCAVISFADIWGVWYFQEIYNKYYPWKYTYYTPEWKKEMTLLE